MPLLAIRQPYDFEVSTERFRAFGPDLANLWHEGGLHRVVGGQEVRIEPAPGGVIVEPLETFLAQSVDDAARAAHALVDKTSVPCCKRAHCIRVGRHERVWNGETVLCNQP